MQRNAIWIGFLLIVAAIAVWFSVKSVYQINHYFRLSGSADATIDEVRVKEVGSDKFVVEAEFSFSLNGKEIKGVGSLGKPFQNRWAAENGAEKLREQPWIAWYDPRYPQRATLQKNFPIKTTLSAAILLALVLYFFCLGLYVGAKKG